VSPLDSRTFYAIHRDHLNVEHLHGYSSDVRIGLYLAVVVMAVLAVLLLAALAAHRARVGGAPDE
jgi:predicted neutral ceramidase superfamily lipid hydrolase